MLVILLLVRHHIVVFYSIDAKEQITRFK